MALSEIDREAILSERSEAVSFCHNFLARRSSDSSSAKAKVKATEAHSS